MDEMNNWIFLAHRHLYVKRDPYSKSSMLSCNYEIRLWKKWIDPVLPKNDQINTYSIIIHTKFAIFIHDQFTFRYTRLLEICSFVVTETRYLANAFLNYSSRSSLQGLLSIMRIASSSFSFVTSEFLYCSLHRYCTSFFALGCHRRCRTSLLFELRRASADFWVSKKENLAQESVTLAVATK